MQPNSLEAERITMAPQPMIQQMFTIRTRPHAFEDVTAQIEAIARASRVETGVCNIFLRHTSASLLICENADPAVRRDLAQFMRRIAPEETEYEHDAEGRDDMPAHIRSTLTGVSLMLPLNQSRLLLGTWQGVYLWEHRDAAHDREIVVTVLGV